MLVTETRLPLYFGAPDFPLFGWLHLNPEFSSGMRIILCPSLGFEGRYLHPTFKALADRLARETGAAVLRFDYAGTGDSCGDDESADQVGRWQSSIGEAISFMSGLGDSIGRTILIGVRAGAALAGKVASERGDIDGIVMWAPCANCKTFVREQRAASRLAHATASKTSAPRLQWGERGFEANGYVYTSQTIEDLEELDLAGLGQRVAARMLLLDRADSPLDPALVRRWREQSQSFEASSIEDYSDMMTSPSDVRIPETSIARIVSWVRTQAELKAPCRVPVLSTSAEVVPGVVESAIQFGPKKDQFGILTRPADSAPGKVFLVLNTAGGYRVGPHGMYPIVARSLATLGFATFRIDIAGIGDSSPRAGTVSDHPYDLDAVTDVEEAVRVLKDRGYRRIAAGGICSAAFLAWHGRSRMQDITDLLLINLQIFEWKNGMTLDVSPLREVYAMAAYRSAIRSAEKWKRLISGRASISSLVKTLGIRSAFIVRSRLQVLRSSLGLGWSASRISPQISRWSAEGTRIHFIFSGDDPGIAGLRSELGSQLRAHEDRGELDVVIVDGPDHSFTSRWATRELISRIADALSAA